MFLFININQGPDKNVFVLVEHNLLWKYNIKNKYWTQYDLHKVYHSLQDGFTGGVQDEQNITWFFKGFKF
jgi:hypothetical protein